MWRAAASQTSLTKKRATESDDRTAPPFPPTWVAAALLFPWLDTALLPLLLLPRSLELVRGHMEAAAGLHRPSSLPRPSLRCQLRPIDSLAHHTRPLRLSPTIPTKTHCPKNLYSYRHRCFSQSFGSLAESIITLSFPHLSKNNCLYRFANVSTTCHQN